MKGLILFVLLLLNTNIGYSTNIFPNVKSNPDTLVRTLLVTKIEKTKQAYFIHVQDTNCYMMVSLRTMNKDKGCTLLKKGKEYQFLVISYFESDMIPRPELSLEIYIEGIKLYVPMSGMNVFLTPNLKGLCYMKQE